MTPVHFHWIETYGYLGVVSSLMLGIFGLPIPDETLLVFIGYLVFKGYFHPVPTVLAAFLGSICGITLTYLVGRTVGLPVLEKYGKYLHVTSERLARAHQWAEKYGQWSLFGGYFLPGVRHLTAFFAGVAGLEYRYFAPFAYSGGFLWVTIFLSLGYFLGEDWHRVAPRLYSYLWILVAGLVVLGLAVYLVYSIRRPQRNKAKQNKRDD